MANEYRRYSSRFVVSRIARSCIKSRGEWVTATCPFSPYTHSKGADRNASFGISVSHDGSSGYNCFSCGERGSLTMLPFKLSQFDGINRPELEEFIRETETPASFPPWELAGKKSKPVVEPISEIDFDIVFDPAYRKRIAVDYFKHRQIKDRLCVSGICVGILIVSEFCSRLSAMASYTARQVDQC